MSAMRSIFTAFIIAAVLAGCGTTQVHLRHEHKVVDSDEYEEDVSACRIYANSGAPMVVTSGHGPQRDIDAWTHHFYGCMRDKGWEAVGEDGEPIDTTPRTIRDQVDSGDAELVR